MSEFTYQPLDILEIAEEAVSTSSPHTADDLPATIGFLMSSQIFAMATYKFALDTIKSP